MRYICIHGHFYQPPRENPWLETIELQDSAYPYHDWNERITAECYAPNAASRILDGQGRIARIVNNYARISFNVGPTLLAWMETQAPEVYQRILEADKESQERFSGHGSALAQAYNHMIMPLAHPRDRYTQALWGIRDFQHRFGRFPEGMWLPETAVDTATLEVLAELGIRFTILAPHQARRVRRRGAKEWQELHGGIDPTMPYEVNLPSGRSIVVFFYDGPISRAVAFEGLLRNGEHLAHRLMSAFSGDSSRPQLVHIATDGETYGHHHRHGDMALAYALHYLERQPRVQLTNYGEFLEMYPPTHEVEIYESTSWSCAHGVERWRSDCGCRAGGHPGWNQGWREPLRKALDWLRDTIAPLFDQTRGRLFTDPWEARNGYIDVVLDRSPERLDAFWERYTARPLSEAEQIEALKLLEVQRHLMLMYTSCGWFFDELSGIETVQVLQYAGRAIQLAEEVYGRSLEPAFLELLARAKSNLEEHRDGAHLYQKYVKPAMVDLRKVGAHYAISSIFESYGQKTRVDCYRVEKLEYRRKQAGQVKMASGRIRVFSRVTRESQELAFAVLHFGDHNLLGGVKEFPDSESCRQAMEAMNAAFAAADLAETIRLLDRWFGPPIYSIKCLFRDEQRKVMELVLESALADTENVYRQIYQLRTPLMRFLRELGMPLPKAFLTAAEYVINAQLRRLFSRPQPDWQRIGELVEEASLWQAELDQAGLAYVLQKTLESMAADFRREPKDLSQLDQLVTAVTFALSLPFEVVLWKVQNVYYEILNSLYPLMKQENRNDSLTARWIQAFETLGERLAVRVSS